MPFMVIANPVPDAGSLRSRAMFGSGSVSPMFKWGVKPAGLLLAEGRWRAHFFTVPSRPHWGSGELKEQVGFRGW